MEQNTQYISIHVYKILRNLFYEKGDNYNQQDKNTDTKDAKYLVICGIMPHKEEISHPKY